MIAPLRSLLFIPGDDTRKLAKINQVRSDAVILDLEDSVSPDRKSAARTLTAQALKSATAGPAKFVRINDARSDWMLADLVAIMPGAPDGIVLPKCEGPADLDRLEHYLDALEACEQLEPGSTKVIAIVTETPNGVVALSSGRLSQPRHRLAGYMWGGEDLAASIGARSPRAGSGQDASLGPYLGPFQLARDLCLVAAAAAEIAAIDAVYTGLGDLGGLARETAEGVRLGFSGKAVIHPEQIAVVNAAYAPTAEDLAYARNVVEAFAATPRDAGAVRLEGMMLDRPHLRSAMRVIAAAGAA